MKPDTLAVIRDLLEHEGYDWRELALMLRDGTTAPEYAEADPCVGCGEETVHLRECSVARWHHGLAPEDETFLLRAWRAAIVEAMDRERAESERWCPQRPPVLPMSAGDLNRMFREVYGQQPLGQMYEAPVWMRDAASLVSPRHSAVITGINREARTMTVEAPAVDSDPESP